MAKPKNRLKVVEGGKKDDGSLYVPSKLIVSVVIDKWKDGRKVQELGFGPIEVLASEEGDSLFGNNIDAAIKKAIDDLKANGPANVPAPTPPALPSTE